MASFLATPIIEYGNGVCGETWKETETLIIPDVSLRKNYIACDTFT